MSKSIRARKLLESSEKQIKGSKKDYADLPECVCGVTGETKIVEVFKNVYSEPEVHKVPEPANLVRRKYLKISLLAENNDQNPHVENTKTFTDLFHSCRNLLYILFSQK